MGREKGRKLAFLKKVIKVIIRRFILWFFSRKMLNNLIFTEKNQIKFTINENHENVIFEIGCIMMVDRILSRERSVIKML